MIQEDNLYKILEVLPSASSSEIKNAYRRKSMEHHPDRGGDPLIFNKVKEAFDVLSDYHKRNRYDMLINVVKISEDQVLEHKEQQLTFDIKQSMGSVSIKQVK